MRTSLVKTAMKTYNVTDPSDEDVAFLAAETKKDEAWVRDVIASLK